MPQIPVAVLGATGSVGQRFVSLLDHHPWFTVVALAASDRSVGQPYAQACRWILNDPMPEYARKMVIVPAAPDAMNAKIVFSALPADLAKDIEPQFAYAGFAVCSNASSYRRAEDVPLLLPEVNADHIQLVKQQRKQRGWSGCITTNPNCTSTGSHRCAQSARRFIRREKSFCCFHAGAIRRGLSRRAVTGYHGQRRSKHRRRGRQSGMGTAQDAWQARWQPS
jgi:hypothetical protein